MCGIFAWIKGNNLKREFKELLLDLNRKRGAYSFGYIAFNYSNNLNQIEISKVLDSEFDLLKNKLFDKNYLFGQFRAPTVEIEGFREDENYPLKIGKNIYLFGNGVINANFYKKLKEKYDREFSFNINNDLFYIGKAILNEGFEFLNKVEGVFALSILVFDEKLKKLNNVYLIRNVYPLYFNENFYSSVKILDNLESKIPKMKELKNALVYDWLNDKIVYRFETKESPFLF